MSMSIKKMFMTKKVVVVGAAVAVALGASTAAFAYFTSTGSGSGSATVGSSLSVTVVQDSIVYNGPSVGANYSYLLPGDTATVAFGITNPGGNENVQTINLTGWTSNVSGCDSAQSYNGNPEAGWFTMPTVKVNQDFAHGTDTTTGDTGTITFNDEAYAQDACQGATIKFVYTSN